MENYVGYETIIEFIELNDILSIDGNLVDIGTFLGGGAYKLSKFLDKEKSSKKLYAIDIFDLAFDKTRDTDGIEMATYYQRILDTHIGKSQREIFLQTIKGCKNIIVIEGDTKDIELSSWLCFGFIDGGHSPKYVENDFYLVWNKLSSGGAVALHDYEYKLPQVTAKIKELISRHALEIEKTYHDKNKHILFVVKKHAKNIIDELT